MHYAKFPMLIVRKQETIAKYSIWFPCSCKTAIDTNIFCNWHKNMKFGQRHFEIRKNIFWTLETIILQFALHEMEKQLGSPLGKIHLAIWKNTFCNLDKYSLHAARRNQPLPWQQQSRHFYDGGAGGNMQDNGLNNWMIAMQADINHSKERH